MLTRLATNRVECLNQVRFGRICGAHLREGQRWCPVCGAPTTTRPLDSAMPAGAEFGAGPRTARATMRADILYLEWLYRREA